MRFNQHSELSDKHAFLSPSSYHWLNYDSQKLEARFYSYRGAQRGTDLHKFAKDAIRLRIYLDPEMGALADYVNHAIDYGMVPEQILYYSDNAFGTADVILFDTSSTYPRPVLRIYDYKSGITATSVKQLEVYAALFCLEYGVDPFGIDYDLRIYQRDEIRVHETSPEGIDAIMHKIIEFDDQIEQLKEAQS
jgi:hypothetical protein